MKIENPPSEEIRDQENVSESEEGFRKIVEKSNEGIVIAQEGKVCYANPIALKITGYSQKEYSSRNFSDFIHPEDRDKVYKAYCRLLNGEKTSEIFSSRYLTKDGEIRWGRFNSVPIVWNDKPATLSFVSDITEQKEAEKALKKEKKLCESLTNSSFDGILAFDRECRYAVWNPAIEHISGVSKEDAIGNCAFDVFPFLKETGEDSYFYDALAGKTVIADERPYKVPGTTHQGYFQGYYSPLYNEECNIIGGLAIIRDITSRKQLENSLKENEEKYRSLSNNIPGMVYRARPDWTTEVISNSEILCGYPASALNSQEVTWLDIIHPDDKDKVIEEASVIHEEPKNLIQEYRIVTKDGNIRWVEDHKTPIFEDGEFKGVDGIVCDITHRKQKEEELHSVNERLQKIFDASPSPIITVDAEGNVTGWNKASEDIFGWSADEVIGKFNPTVPEDLKDLYFKSIEEKQINIEIKVLKKDNSCVDLLLSSNPLFDRKGNLVGAIGVMTDFTEHKRSEEKLQKSEQKALKESEENYRTTFEHTETAMIVIEEDTTISMLNEEFERLSGYSREELEGKRSWTEFVHPQDLEWMKKYHMGRRKGEKIPTRYEFRAIDRQGNIRNVLLMVEMLPGTRKSICFMTDITYIKRLNNLLKVTTEINELVAREKSPDVVLEAVCEDLGLLYDGVFTTLGNDIEHLEALKSKGVDLKSIEKSIRACPSIKEAIKGEVKKIRAGGEICENCLNKPHNCVLSIPLFNEKCYGVITIHSDFDFDEEEITLLEKLASNIAFALNAYEVEKDKTEAMHQLVQNLVQFDRSADRLRNPLAAIMATLELRDYYDEGEILSRVAKQVRRIKEELDKLREEEDKTYRLVRERLENEGYLKV